MPTIAGDLLNMCVGTPGPAVVVWQGQTTQCPKEAIDTPKPDGFGELTLQTETVLFIPTSVLTGIHINDSILVDDLIWYVRDVRLVDDGLLRHVYIAAPRVPI